MRIFILAAALIAIAFAAYAQQRNCTTWCNGPPGYQTCYTRCW